MGQSAKYYYLDFENYGSVGPVKLKIDLVSPNTNK